MKFEWSPALGPLNGAFVFLSASVPDPARSRRFLAGPVNEDLMLRVIDQRVDSAVKSLLFQTLNAGGRIVHGGHPKIMLAITHQANQWKVADGTEPPIHIYQSKIFADAKPPPGREEIARAGTGKVHWVPADLKEVMVRWEIPPDLIARHLPLQAAFDASAARGEALLAMRLEMLLLARPTSAVCIGGMEGIEAEARLYLDLARLGLIPRAEHVHVIGSTYGASAQLVGEGVIMADRQHFDPRDVVDTGLPEVTLDESGARMFDARNMRAISLDVDREGKPGPQPVAPATALEDLQRRISYNGTMRSLVKSMAPGRS